MKPTKLLSLNPTKLLSFLEIFSKGEALEKKLLRNHLIAVLVLITMVSISFLILTSIIQTQHNSSNLINTSGKQRMYTQKVLYYVNKYEQTKRSLDKDNIYDTLEKLEINNKYLTRKLVDRDSISFYNKNLMLLYNKKDGTITKYEEFKNSIEIFINKHEHNKDIDIQDIEKQGDILIDFYDQLTSQYQKLAEDKVSEFWIYETSLYIISLLTILLEALLIFRPAIFEVFTTHTKLRKLNKNLSREVEKQVEALREQEQLLIQQSKLAEMGEMLSNISHQWKQPLTILSMQIEDLEMSLMADEIEKQESEKSIENCFVQISLMSNTIEDFKRFYMPDNEKKEFNIYDLIKDVVKMEQSSLQKHNISIEIKVKDQTLKMYGFESQLKQVLLSLTNNAIEQISQRVDENSLNKMQGSIKYGIHLKDEFTRISIYDNAGGIKKDVINKIFNPYFSTKKEKGGSGIGLYMAKTIIENSFYGELHVKNIKSGAKFYIDIPNSKV